MAKRFRSNPLRIYPAVASEQNRMACEPERRKDGSSWLGCRPRSTSDNIHRRENGAWKMIHDHTDISPAMIDLLARLQAKA